MKHGKTIGVKKRATIILALCTHELRGLTAHELSTVQYAIEFQIGEAIQEALKEQRENADRLLELLWTSTQGQLKH